MTMAAPRIDRTAGELIGLLTQTPLVREFSFMGRHLRAETNSPRVLQYLQHLGETVELEGSKPDFLWRLLSDVDAVPPPTWPRALGLSDGAIGLVTFGQSTFVAANYDDCEAVAVVADELTGDEAAFREHFLAALCSLTAEGLGLERGAALGELLDTRNDH
jgi:hypothetical protein